MTAPTPTRYNLLTAFDARTAMQESQSGKYVLYHAYEILERELAALRASQPREWQPMETAPKDGTKFLIALHCGDTLMRFDTCWAVDPVGGGGFEAVEPDDELHGWMPLPEWHDDDACGVCGKPGGPCLTDAQRESLERSIAQVNAGELRDLGSFAEFAEDDASPSPASQPTGEGTGKVHNHGPEDGNGISCPETRQADGSLRGACMATGEGTPKYWTKSKAEAAEVIHGLLGILEGESGTGASYWEQNPAYVKARAWADRTAENHIGEGTEYDRAIQALAPFLPDGWVAQDRDGETYWYNSKPNETVNQWQWEYQENDRDPNQLELIIPETHWRTSLRRILSGSVSPLNEGGDK